MKWKKEPGTPGVQAPISHGGKTHDYVISHRTDQHTVSYRPPGKHEHVGTFTTEKAAKVAAVAHSKGAPRSHARKKSPTLLDREIAEVLAKKPADQWTVHDRLAVMTPTQKKRELKDLQRAKEQTLRALGYAGNTPDQVRKYHDAIDEIDAKMKLFAGSGSAHARQRSHSTKAMSNGLFAVEIDRSAFDSDRDLPDGARWRADRAKLAEDELARGRSHRRPKDARYAVIEWTGYRGAVGRLLDWLEGAAGVTRYAEIFE